MALKQAPIKRRRKAFTASEREASEAWHRGIAAKVCAVCGQRKARDAHHVIRVQVLRREAKARGFDIERVRWDTRNRLPACSQCHADHHSRKRPISLSVLRKHAPKVFQFARELGLDHVLSREYAN